ncbi:beta strand repeat-containing protein [Haliscomenobacter hydrossis]|uniref:Ig domain protein group 2 domain protein n=1 Tax=Haliscomenobacter hydrossis (strain ATCC 27775 / DSM 1100 / LMG 10767 / O) TaxID=760192 RepID=F4L4P1_HALH1|nr:Ig-like domain-containing protein [Haliscomenobacter hydrossis]AEE52989.1 Ig domain protein group 2 domain protein [Haliscomenobacter hydrossis DSM 1100]
MKRILLLSALLIYAYLGFAALSPGDIAFVQYNADGTDNFAFVALVNIPAGEEIKFTDNGWFSTNSFRTGEGTMTWTAPVGGVSAGTVVTITATPSASVGTITAFSLAISADGDQLLAYQGLDSAPVFITAMNNEGAAVWQATATNSNDSGLPNGLTNGTNAVAITEIDNAVYTGTTTGTKAALLAALMNKDNWTGSNTVNQTFSGTFSITAAAPNLSINDVSFLEGNSGTTDFTFTVSLSSPAGPGGVTFDIATANNTATLADNDYVSNGLTGQVIPAGSSSYMFTVLVNGDVSVEPNETFFVNITNVVGATVTDGQGQGTIQNDDFITPTFTQLGPYCVGDTPDALPGTSENSITGTWDPATISTASSGTTTYTFTPDGGQGASTTTMDITVNPLPTLTLSASSVSSANCGDMVSVEIGVNNTFEDIGSLQFSVNWNPAQLEYVSNSALQIGGGSPVLGDVDVASGDFIYSWIDPAGFDGEDLANTTVILTLNFKVIATSGTASVNVSSTPTPMEVANSSFCIATPSTDNFVMVSLENTTTLVGDDEVCIDSDITLTGSGTPAAVNPYISSNPAVATVDDSGLVSGLTVGSTTITYTNNNGCTATKEVTINTCDCEAPPFVNFTPLNTTGCVGGTVTIGYTVLNGPATINTTGFLGTFSANVILTDGTGTFTYTPDAAEVGTTLTIFANIPDPDGPCTGDTASASITVNPVLEPTFAAFGPYCQGEIPLALPTTSNNGISGFWSPSTISTASPGTTSYYFFLNEEEECADSASIKVVVSTPVTVEAGTPQTICSNQTLDLSDIGASISGGTSEGTWSSSGTGSFTGGTAFGSATAYIPSEADKTAGTVTLTLTSIDPDGPCPAKVDTVVITIKNLNCGTFPWNGGNN